EHRVEQLGAPLEFPIGRLTVDEMCRIGAVDKLSCLEVDVICIDQLDLSDSRADRSHVLQAGRLEALNEYRRAPFVETVGLEQFHQGVLQAHRNLTRFPQIQVVARILRLRIDGDGIPRLDFLELDEIENLLKRGDAKQSVVNPGG